MSNKKQERLIDDARLRLLRKEIKNDGFKRFVRQQVIYWSLTILLLTAAIYAWT